jgi:NAD(P)-dependent dehydrogenase (short-subunit alcohol dehydrogenase family)
VAVHAAVGEFARKCGRLDYLFNNAGIGMGGEVHEIPLEAWHRVVDVNIWGVVHGVQAAYPLMRAQGFGHIVNTASMAGLGPGRGRSPRLPTSQNHQQPEPLGRRPERLPRSGLVHGVESAAWRDLRPSVIQVLC